MTIQMAAPIQAVESSPQTTLSRFAVLAEAFERGGVSCCTWKSARRFPDVFAGRSDLDLLVARADRQEAVRILNDCGFKHAPDAAGRDDPAIMSFLAYDETGAILHAHVHFRLVIGASLLKRFHLPCDTSFLARSRLSPEFHWRVLAPSDEALLLLVRAHVEYSALDPIQHRRRGQIAQKLRDDFAEIRQAIDREALRQAAAEIFSATLADAIARAASDADPMRRQRDLAARIKRELSAFNNYNSVEAFVRARARTARFFFGALNRRYFGWARSWGRRAPGGGVVIAFVGVDGSGKSTAVANVRNWLGAEVDIVSVYFGTGDGAPSLLLRPFKALAGLAGRLVKTKPKGASHGAVSDCPPGPVYSVLFAVWALAVALDKRHKLIFAQRAARRGFVVVTDRYPQNELPDFNDGPLLHRLPHAPRWLKRFETSVYSLAQRAPPDLVVKLHVGPEVVARREPDMSRAVIGARVAGLADLRFAGARIVSIDAQRPLDEVTRIIKREVWAIL